MASEIKVDKITHYSGNATTLGTSGQKIQIASGATINNSGSKSGFGGGKIVGMKSVTYKGTMEKLLLRLEDLLRK